MNVGYYVRIKDAGINKISSIIDNEVRFDEKPIFSDGECIGYKWCFKKDIIKSSPNIIDLIEVGDYVNGHRVNYVNKDREHFNISFGDEDFNLKSKFNSDIYWLSKEDIKTIVTKEQFESMEYKVDE